MALKQARRGLVPPFIVMDVLRAANQRAARGEAVLHLEVGQPFTPAPRGVLEAAKAALSGDRLGYTDALGVPPLREAIARYYKAVHRRDLDPSRVVVTTGSSGAFILGFLACFDAGDRVALASPGYPAYRNILKALDVSVVEIPVGPETNFQPTPELLAQAEGRIDGLIVASPANPTGTMIGPEPFRRLAVHCRDKGIRLVSDEIYHGITYQTPAETALAFDDNAIVVNSFSKYFSMTGWRLGWMVVPPDLLRGVECLAQNLFISPPTLSQLAAVAAFDCREELDGHVARYARNRALLLSELPKAGFGRLAAAEGAFYLYADISDRTNDSDQFCQKLLAETGIAATPGIDFDPGRGNRSVRFCFAGSEEEIATAAKLLKAWRA
jgi:aspartate/methionine/tyrosine aminotransferase